MKDFVTPDHDAPAETAEAPKPTTSQPKLAETAPTGPAPARGTGRKRLILMTVAVLVLGGVGYEGWQWWTVGRFTQSTDDAYVQADTTTFAAKVSGTIATVPVADNASVKAGDTLLTLDPVPFQLALDKAKADQASAVAAVTSAIAQQEVQKANVSATEAQLKNAEAQLSLAQTNADRSASLLAKGSVTAAQRDEDATALDAAKAALTSAQSTVQAAQGTLAVLAAQRQAEEAALLAANSAVAQAQQNLTYTVVRASTDGIVGNRGVEIGEYVGTGTQMISVVPVAESYVIANFKETQVADFRAGMAVDIAADTLGGLHFRGTIDSLSPATGSVFSILPPQNATGNFTKIVQRIPVKIVIDPADRPALAGLRPGTSVTASINIKGAGR